MLRYIVYTCHIDDLNDVSHYGYIDQTDDYNEAVRWAARLSWCGLIYDTNRKSWERIK